MKEETIRCESCFRQCVLKEGQIGFCKARQNKEGKIIDRNYGKLTSLALDPIEKKPLAYFHPGSLILSVGSYGCNLACPFCQNHEIAKEDLDDQSQYFSPQELVDLAENYQPMGNIGLAFTYNEPTVGWEYVRDAARLAKEKGLKTVLVTNGSTSQKVLDELVDVIDAYNIDLKGFSQEYYDYVGGDFESVKAFIEKAARHGHVEVTTLIVPGKNDSPQEIEALSRWLASIDPGIPLHLTRYFPRYKESRPATDVLSLFELKRVAENHLHRVKLGNV